MEYKRYGNYLILGKAEKYNLADRMEFHNCPQKRIGLNNDVKADFILAFYMLHEMPEHIKFLSEVKTLLKKGGRSLAVICLIQNIINFH